VLRLRWTVPPSAHVKRQDRYPRQYTKATIVSAPYTKATIVPPHASKATIVNPKYTKATIVKLGAGSAVKVC
jgi:hypothetical protein